MLALRLREIVTAGAVTQPAQYPTLTTQWVETVLNGVTTYVQIIYTQTFNSYPGLTDPAMTQIQSGSIGLGTIQGTVGVTKAA